ncbi:hypothetical protein ACOMHN_021521 [Nucella lapillus]
MHYCIANVDHIVNPARTPIMADILVCLWPTVFALFLFVGGVQAGEFCYKHLYTSVTYCDYGCCGSSGKQYCCEWSPTVALIMGCIFAGLFVISVIAVIVCCCIKKKAHSGKVISPAPGYLQPRPGARTNTAGPATVTTTVHPTAPQMAAFYSGTGVYQLPPPSYDMHHLPPLTQPPAYQAPAPPPAYDIYSTAGPQQQQQQQQHQQQ